MARPATLRFVQTILALAGVLSASMAHANIVNPSFETGDLTGWQSIGSATVVTSAFGSGPTDGAHQALVSNGGGVTVSVLESFLGVPAGTLNGLGNGTSTIGSAIEQTFTASAGTVVTFDWNFLTGEVTPSFSFNDYAFVTISAVASTLANTHSTFVVSATSFGHETGFHSFAFTIPATGTYTIAVGAVDVGDTAVDSAVLVDNFSSSCGDGILDTGEQCDDGNRLDGDGCDRFCRIEPCFACSGQPSACSTIPDGSACDDGLFCNGTDTCAGGSCTVHTGDPCVGGPECDNLCNESGKNCALPAGTACAADTNPCTLDECDGMGSCVHPPAFNFSPCDDGVFCDGADSCLNGLCQIHDGDPCTGNECAPTCDEAAQICDPVALGAPCTDDGLPCTSDQCDGIGFCSHPPTAGGTPCPDDGNACTVDECNGVGLCIHPPQADGAPCDDANACTQTDRCQSGQCVGTDPIICTAPTCYQPGTCDPSNGACTNCPPGYAKANGGCQRQYAIDASLLDDLPFLCGPTQYTCNTGFGFGFHWTDTADDAVGDVAHVDIEIQPGNDCSSLPHSVALNDVSIGAYAATTAATCSCFPGDAPAVLANVDTAAYVKGGDNTVAISTATCAGLGPDAGGHYAVVSVTYADPGLATDLLSGCRSAAKSRFGYKNNASDALDRLRWTWGKGAATSKADFGNPTAATAYRLCVFRETASKPVLLFSSDVPPGAPAWNAAQSGFTYGDGAGSYGGIHSMRLRGGGAGDAKISIGGQGANLSDPALPLPLDTAGIRAQLTNESSGTCWESEFPLSRITADDKRIRATVH